MILEVLATTVTVTGFVLVMMLLVGSPTGFMRVKAINLVAGLVLGYAIMLMGI